MAGEPNRWENVDQSKAEAETSWFEDRPQVSPDLIAATGAASDATIGDVSAAASRLVNCLLDQGFRRIAVLDLSDTALAGQIEPVSTRPVALSLMPRRYRATPQEQRLGWP